ncbi:hypothetical protein GOEFS_027_00090 [Gordonia effusa NBRC 100432]|uniref:Uncharacterized protein n=1 Tax=Gordonia effusa NBRC 100432 TaxID=1077974 RepID=H0QWY2_9ACTN|nr:hypothetical protein GOEFS_027_00090 [Gordonia effusa NBRC 100432]
MNRRGGVQLAVVAVVFTLILVSAIAVIGRPTAGQPRANPTAILISWLDQASDRDKLEAPFTASATTTQSGRDEVIARMTVEVSKPMVQVAIRVACFSAAAHSNLLKRKESFFATLDGTRFGSGSCSPPPVDSSPIRGSAWIGITLEPRPYPPGLRTFTVRVTVPQGGLLAVQATFRYAFA